MTNLMILFGNKTIQVQPSTEFTNLLNDIQDRNGHAEYIPQLLKVSSAYNYYDAIGNDSKAGAILVNHAGTEHHDRILAVAKELLKHPEYNEVYNSTKKEYDYIRIQRGKEVFGVMLENNKMI